jgi:hypothetical protein
VRQTMIAAVLVAVVGAPVHADTQLWTELGVRHNLSRRLEVTFDQHLRFDDDLSRFGAFMPEPGLTYRVAPWFRVGGGYRMEYERNGDGDMVLHHRFFTFARSRVDAGPMRIEHRLQLQETVRPGSNDQYRHTVRNRIDVGYRGIKRWTPAAQAELFHAIDRGDALHLDKVWLSLGGTYSHRQRESNVYFRVELPVADTMEPTLYILGAAFHLEL